MASIRLQEWLIAQAKEATAKAIEMDRRGNEARERAAKNMADWQHQYPEGTDGYRHELRVAGNADMKAAALRAHAKMLMEF